MLMAMLLKGMKVSREHWVDEYLEMIEDDIYLFSNGTKVKYVPSLNDQLSNWRAI